MPNSESNHQALVLLEFPTVIFSILLSIYSEVSNCKAASEAMQNWHL